MPSLLSGGKALKGTTGSESIFITLPTAQLSLGTTPSTATGYTLVTEANGQLGWTATLGKIFFEDGVVRRSTSGTNLIIESTGTGTLQLNGNVLINGRDITAAIGTLTNLVAVTATIEDLIINRSITFNSATSTATFSSDVRVKQDLRVDEQLTVYGNVSLSPDGGLVEIKPAGAGSVNIRPGSLGQMDNVNIGDFAPANGRFDNLTATNITVDNFTVTNSFATTGTFEKVRVLSTESDALTVAGGVTVTNALFAGSLYDNGVRVISQINVGAGVAVNTNTGPTVTLTNTGVLSLTAGTDTVVSTSTGDVIVWNNSTLQSVTARGNSTTNVVQLLNTSTAGTSTGALQVAGGISVSKNLFVNETLHVDSTESSTSTTSGAITVAGGLGVAENINAHRIYEENKRVLTEINILTADGLVGGGTISESTLTLTLYNIGVVENFAGDGISLNANTGLVTITNDGVLSLTAGTGTAVSSTSGNITVWNTSTLQSVTDLGNTTNNIIHITNATTATSTTSGALQVAGGVGVGGDVYSDGGSPFYNRLLYTPKVTVSASVPTNPRVGDFWIDPTIGVEFQYVPNGTQTVWIQFIGF